MIHISYAPLALFWIGHVNLLHQAKGRCEIFLLGSGSDPTAAAKSLAEVRAV
jgi:hypothetical protein